MSAVPTAAASAANTSNAVSNPVAQVLGTQGIGQFANDDTLAVDWDSEIQLVSSLAKLQELERKVSVRIAISQNENLFSLYSCWLNASASHSFNLTMIDSWPSPSLTRWVVGTFIANLQSQSTTSQYPSSWATGRTTGWNGACGSLWIGEY